MSQEDRSVKALQRNQHFSEPKKELDQPTKEKGKGKAFEAAGTAYAKTQDQWESHLWHATGEEDKVRGADRSDHPVTTLGQL